MTFENTKQKGDIAEQATVLIALKFGWGVSIPVGDRMPYDLIFDVDGVLFKIQVKSAWYDTAKQNFVVDNRKTKTNRRQIVRSAYGNSDFDFAVIFIDEIDVFYIMPVEIFTSYGSDIHLVESTKRQRKPKSAIYRNAWEIIRERAALLETTK